MMLLSGFIAIMVGSLSSMREIVKEKSIDVSMVGCRLSLTFCLRSARRIGVFVSSCCFRTVKELAVDIPGGLEVAIGFT